MNAFQYATAVSTDSAQQMAADHGAYIAGGNDLLGRLKEYLDSPATVVNIKSIPGMRDIKPGDDHWAIGALVTVAEIEDNSQIRGALPTLQQAAAEVGSQQIRNVATVGGNLAQHSRCWYYRHRDTVCLKKGGDLCYARHGENRYHTLFTGNSCVSPVVSNLATAFAALDATVIVLREGKETRMSVADVYQRAWENPTAHNSLTATDLILRVEIPSGRRHGAYLQVSDKHAFDWALVSCAAAANVTDGKLNKPRVALGCISPIPHQVAAANEFLEGKTLDDATVTRAAEMILQDAQPLQQNGYKVPMARALIRRTLLSMKG
jgi:xanthine dehydrogenase YagS FAD-binding subunit